MMNFEMPFEPFHMNLYTEIVIAMAKKIKLNNK